jgi:hypothetical protein
MVERQIEDIEVDRAHEAQPVRTKWDAEPCEQFDAAASHRVAKHANIVSRI